MVIGKSEWKKLAKWMKELGKDGVLKIKESKGEVTVTSSVQLTCRWYWQESKAYINRFNQAQPSIQGHAPFLTIAKDDAKSASKAARETAAAEMGEAGMVSTPKGKQLLIEELWKPAGSGLAFWEACGIE